MSALENLIKYTSNISIAYGRPVAALVFVELGTKLYERSFWLLVHSKQHLYVYTHKLIVNIIESRRRK